MKDKTEKIDNYITKYTEIIEKIENNIKIHKITL
jgi:hypothetical protein